MIPPPVFMMIILVLAVFAMFTTKTLLDHRRAEMELKARSDADLSDRSLTRSELVELIRTAVHEETRELTQRLDAIEEHLSDRRLTLEERGGGETFVAGRESTEKTLGRPGRAKE